MNINTKLLACDIDGTIMNSCNKLTDRTKDTLQKVVNSGIKLVIATGRSFNAIDPKIMSIKGIEYAIVANGSAIYDIASRKCIYKDEMDTDTAINILASTENFDVFPSVFVGADIYANRLAYDSLLASGVEASMLNYFKMSRIPVDNVKDFLKQKKQSVAKIFLLMNNRSEKEKIIESLALFDNVFITSSGLNNIEIVSKTADKSTALKFIGEKFKISKNEIMSAGDSPNDIGMFKASGFSIAMGNAYDEVKKIANFVTDTNDNDGLAKALENFIVREST